MLRVKNSVLYAIFLMLGDALAVTLAFFGAFYLRNHFLNFELVQGPIQWQMYQWLLPIFVLVHGLTFAGQGAYLSNRRSRYRSTSLQVLYAVLLGGLISASVVFYSKSQLLSRLYFLIFSGLLLVLSLALHNAVVWFLGWFHARGLHQRRVLVIGNPKKIPEVLALLRRKPEWGFHVVDSVTPSEKKVREIFSTQIIDEVFFHVTPEELAKLQPILELCEIHGAPLHFYSDILPLKYSKPRLEFFLDEPVLSYYRKYLSLDQIIMKRLLDLMGGLVGSLLTVLITPGIALLIKLEDGGPVFFSQKRVGVNRRHFTVYKFRTMRVDAPKLRKKLQAKNEMKGNLFKMKDDPRITKVGKWLRKTSLDEFPQFFNVLVGTMSLVGPRPLPVEDMAHYEQHHYRRLRAKPGITGFWQVRGRNKIQSYERMVQLDNRYIDYWSIGLDLSILFQTVKILFAKKTGY